MAEDDQTITLEQVERMLETLQQTDVGGRAARLAFNEKKLSKRARLASLEEEVELLHVLVNVLMVAKLVTIRDELRNGKAIQDWSEFLTILARATTLKAGKG